MAGIMDIDSPISTDDRIIEKLVEFGVPEGLLKQNCYEGLLLYTNNVTEPQIFPDLVSCILSAASSEPEPSGESYTIALQWIQWLMFRQDPQESLQTLAEKSAGTRGVCGAVWGQNDLAYRCRTCEHDPTCAICVPCFQNGDHTGHDYSIMYTGGGCCDCGDVTAWKREGFCKKHQGAEKIEPLPDELAQSVGPVLDAVLIYWKDKVASAEPSGFYSPNTITTAMLEMLLQFCSSSESLLSFVATHIYAQPDLLDLLLRCEKLLDKPVLKKLHELLLKLIADPNFKFQFALSFVRYYPVTVSEIAKGSGVGPNGGELSYMEEYPLLGTFSVQIFTVPTLTPRLVRDVDLLGVLVGCLTEVLVSCIGDDGHLQANRWANQYELIMRLVDDTKYVLTHDEVSTYLAQNRPDVSSKWIQILQTLQFMDPHKRVTTIHTEDENENLAAPFVLGQYIGSVNNLIVKGAFCNSSDDTKEFTDVTLCASSSMMEGMHRDAKVGRLLPESGASGCCPMGFPIPSTALWLALECIKAIEIWLKPDFLNHNTDSSSSVSLSSLPIKVGRFGRMQIGNKGKSIVMRTQVSPTPTENKTLLCKLSDGTFVYTEPGTEFDVNGGSSLFRLAAWPYVVFDVSSQEISFHIPLHRFLSLLLRRAMKWTYGERDSNQNPHSNPNSRQDNFFGQVLGGYGSPGLAALLMEHPLRVRVFCAQVRAGMWRKNGDAVILSAEWYRSVQWLEQGLEADLFLLQCCASLAPADAFVRAVQDRFGLSTYTSLNITDHNEYEAMLVQEMLTFLIQLVKERRYCGLSTVDNLKREIIHKLCIGDVTHSQLVKSLPRDLSKNENLQQILNSLAVYSNPSGMKQGKYSLKKEHWKELDLYHPRWNSRDLQAAEERYFRFCKSSPLNSQIPKWTQIFNPLNHIRQIATARATLEIVRAVLYYSVCGELAPVSRAPENVLVVALHLTALALQICELESKSQLDTESFSFLKYASEEFGSDKDFGRKQSLILLLCVLRRRYKEENEGGNGSGHGNGKFCNVLGLIEDLLKKFVAMSGECIAVVREVAPDLIVDVMGPSGQGVVGGSRSGMGSDSSLDKKAKARERQAAILAKMRAEQSKFAESLKSSGDEATEDQKLDKEKAESSSMDFQQEESLPVCSLCHDSSSSQSPLCYLILLQKSKLLTFAEKGTPSWDEGSTSSDIGAGSSDPSEDLDSPFSPSSGISLEEYSIEIDPSSDEESAQLPAVKPIQPVNPNLNSSLSGSHSLVTIEEEIYSLILQDLVKDACDTEKGKITKSPSVSGMYAACLKRDSSKNCETSKIMKSPLVGLRTSAFFSMQSGTSLVSPKREKLTGSSSGLGKTWFGPIDCDGVHISSCGHAVHQECHERYLFSLKQRFIRRLGFEGGHIVDPDMGELLCPVCRRFANSTLPATSQISSKFPSQLPAYSPPLTASSTLSPALSLLQSASKIVGKESFLKTISSILKTTPDPSLEPSIKKFSTLYYPQSSTKFSSDDRLSESLLLWDTLRYSIISTEIAARGRKKSCVEALNGELNSSSGFILSLLFGVARAARNLRCTEVFLRYKGLQLIAGSVCFGLTGANDPTNTSKRRGMFASISETTSEGEMYPDMQFWKLIADPVLSRDPFSSLLWSLFCLPVPFLSSDEFFLPLVHLFYVICLVQALITCYTHSIIDTSCFSHYPIHDIMKSMSSIDFVKTFFISNSCDPFSSPVDSLRRLTFPFLRRCALLHKMLTSATKGPLYDSCTIWDGSGLNLSQDPSDRAHFVRMELEGLRELEAVFQVPPLETILKDEVVNGLVLKWCQHFCEEFKNFESMAPLYCVPAVPFRLMQLPTLYQDLLQRYVKMQCSECANVPDEPALCLLCGRLCSPSWKSCCRAGKCQNHAVACGAGIGVFLLVRKTTILLQRSARLAFWPSPYLDAFGEEDHDMHRGRPLFLSEERYAALKYLVASHSLDRTSEVLRQTTIGLYSVD
ncbi:E3 ubiquitin-protein ligase PRT6 [Rhynchospora pubera]|uniref:E3 ubiquitin-protein ligase n=1 Tax=Rhynchospora pubera TaxID=906938 RepID=A0AAV8FF32_9POAL|nr:E3 ubiquitin-protein ligase PRT6 [Rhynchospora pubera]